MTDSATAPAPAADKPSIMDCAEIFYAPSGVFERRRQGKFGMPLLVFIVLSVVIFLAARDLLQPLLDIDFNRGLAKQMATNPQFTQDMANSAHATMTKFAPIGAAFFAVIVPFIVGFVVWLVAKFAGAALGLAQGMVIGVFAMFPTIVEGIANAVQMSMNGGDVTSKYDVSVGPARFMTGASEVIRTAVGHIDLWTIWMAFLIYLGVKALGKTSKGTAMNIAIITWVVGVLPALISALRNG